MPGNMEDLTSIDVGYVGYAKEHVGYRRDPTKYSRDPTYPTYMELRSYTRFEESYISYISYTPPPDVLP